MAAPDRTGSFWLIQARVTLLVGDCARAHFQACRAESLGAPSPASRRLQSVALLRSERFTEAVALLQELVAEGEQDLRSLLVDALRGVGQTAEALTLSQLLIGEPSVDEFAVFRHACLLIDAIEDVPAMSSDDKYMVTTMAELESMEALFEQVLALPLTAQDKAKLDIADVADHLARSRARLANLGPRPYVSTEPRARSSVSASGSRCQSSTRRSAGLPGLCPQSP